MQVIQLGIFDKYHFKNEGVCGGICEGNGGLRIVETSNNPKEKTECSLKTYDGDVT